MKKLPVVFGAVALLVAALYVATPAILRSQLDAERIASLASEALGRPVSIAAVRYGPGAAVRLEGVDLGGEIELASAELRIELLPLLSRSLEPSRLELRGVRLSVERGADGSVRVEGLRMGGEDGAEPGDPSGAVAPPPRIELRDARVAFLDRSLPGGERSTHFDVDRLEVRDLAEGETASFSLDAAVVDGGSFQLSGRVGPVGLDAAPGDLSIALELTTDGLDPDLIQPYLPESWMIDSASGALDGQVSLRIEGGDYRGQLDLTLTEGTLDFAGIGMGARTTFEAGLEVVDGALTFSDARVMAKTATYNRWNARDVGGDFRYDQQTLHLEDFSLVAYDGTWRPKGSVVFWGDPSFDLELEVEKARADELLGFDDPLADEDPPLFAGNGAFQGRWTDEPNWLAPIDGSGRVAFTGGTMPSEKLLSAVASAMLSKVPGLRRELDPDEAELNRLKSMTASFRIEDGRVRTDDFEVVSDKYSITAVGSLRHDQSVEMRAEVAFTAAGIRDVYKVMRLGRADSSTTLPAIPVDVSGHFYDPDFSVESRDVPITAAIAALAGAASAVDATEEALGWAREGSKSLVHAIEDEGRDLSGRPADKN